MCTYECVCIYTYVDWALYDIHTDPPELWPLEPPKTWGFPFQKAYDPWGTSSGLGDVAAFLATRWNIKFQCIQNAGSSVSSCRKCQKEYLVGCIPTPLKNISQLGWFFPIEKVPNHQPDMKQCGKNCNSYLHSLNVWRFSRSGNRWQLNRSNAPISTCYLVDRFLYNILRHGSW